MQVEAPVQLTPVPPKPTCVQIFNSGSCADLWRAYNQAVQQRTQEELQIYVNRQKALASSEATAPLQQQINDLNKLVTDQQTQIKKMQEQMQADSTAAIQAKTSAHTQGMEQGAGLGVSGALLLVGIVFGGKKLASNFTVSRKPRAQAAASGK